MRDSLPPPPKTIKEAWGYLIVTVVIALAGAISGAISNWQFGLITQADLDKVKAHCAPAAATDKAFAALSLSVTANDSAIRRAAEELHGLSEHHGLLLEERAADQIALHAAMRLVGTNAQRASVERTRREAYTRIQELVLQQKMTPQQAVERVLGDYGVPR